MKIVSRVVLLLFCFGLTQVQSQVAQSVELKPVAFRTGKKVYLRWSLGTGAQWRQANTLGFNVERAANGSANFELLNKTPLKPITLAAAQKYGTKNPVYIVATLVQQKPDPKDKNATDDNGIYGYYLLMSSYQ